MIRKAEEKDIRIVSEKASKLFNESDVEKLENEFYRLLKDENSIIYVKILDDKIIGFAQCGLRFDYVEGTDSSPVGYLEGIYIDDSYRNKNFAKDLVGHCENWAKSKSCIEFASDCEYDNLNSYKFHLSIGFEEANKIICFTKKL